MAFKRILLVKPSGRHGLSFAYDIVPTGLEYIAAYIEDAVDLVDVIDLEMEQPKPYDTTMNEYLDELKPDLVGISMSATDHTEGLELASIAKKRGITTVLGGYHPSAIPDELLSHPQVDIIVRGEGEITMHELVTKGNPIGIKGISYKDQENKGHRNKGHGNKDHRLIIHNPDREFIKDLDSIPFPARHLRRHVYDLTLKQGRVHDVLTTSRGCWGKCSFCCEPTMSLGKQRYRSPENVLAEILEIVKLHDGKPLSLEVTDPHFMGKPRVVEQLCDILAPYKLDIVFIVKVRPDMMAKFPEVVRKMISVGIDTFEMGIESPSMKDLKYTSKNVETDMHELAVSNIKKWGGYAGGTLVVGLPDHTEEEVKQFPIYAKRIGLVASAYGIATPFPGTGFYEELDSQGLIFETDWNKFDEMHSVFKAKYLSKERIEELATFCMAKFWTMDTFIEKERMRMIKRGAKRPLMEFIIDRVNDLKFSIGTGLQLQKGNFSRHVQEYLEASPDPGVKTYTEEIGMHNIIDMSRFLKLLGAQTMQLTIVHEGAPFVSWILKTTKDRVEYIQAINGKLEDGTINLTMDISDFLSDSQQCWTMIDYLGIGVKFFGTNKGIKRKLNLFRFFMASGIEIIKFIGTKNGSAAIRALK